MVCLAGLFASRGAASQDNTCAEASGCRNRVNPCEALYGGGEVRNGEVILRIAYDYDVDSSQKEAFEAGMKMWNEYRGTTKVAFEIATGNVYDLRLQKGGPRHLQDTPRADVESKQCATYEPLGSYIWYSPNGMAKVLKEASLEAAASIYAHELGHALNICHKPESPLMKAGDPKVCCHVHAKTLPHDIPKDDVLDANRCGYSMNKMARGEDALLVLVRLLRQRDRLLQRTPFRPFVPLMPLLPLLR